MRRSASSCCACCCRSGWCSWRSMTHVGPPLALSCSSQQRRPTRRQRLLSHMHRHPQAHAQHMHTHMHMHTWIHAAISLHSPGRPQGIPRRSHGTNHNRWASCWRPEPAVRRAQSRRTRHYTWRCGRAHCRSWSFFCCGTRRVRGYARRIRRGSCRPIASRRARSLPQPRWPLHAMCHRRDTATSA